jgi:mercuric ion transport protein
VRSRPDPLLADGPGADAAEPAPEGKSTPALARAGIAALLASTCCVLPLVFAIVGVSGAWIAQLHWMTPYSGALSALAVVALAIAGWRIYGPARQGAQCEADSVCARTSGAARGWFWALAALTLLPLVLRFAAPLFY